MALTPEEQAELQQLEALVSKIQTEQPKQPGMAEQALDIIGTNPMQKIAQTFSPSNLGKAVGAMTANAPGMTMAAQGMMPGTPAQGMMAGMQNVAQNPQQVPQALQRGMEVGGGAPLQGEEVKPGMAGMAGGLALEAMAPNMATGGKATGPFTAGLSDPSTALPGVMEKAGEALGKAKGAARAGDDIAEASRLRSLLLKGKSGVVKVAEEGKKAIESGKDASVTQLLAYREGLGKTQAMGGTFANDYKKAFDLANEMLAKKAPDLMAALKKYNLASLAKEGPEFAIPFLETSISPIVGAAKAGYKAMQMAPVRNAAGAALGASGRAAVPASSLMLEAYDKVFNKKKKGK